MHPYWNDLCTHLETPILMYPHGGTHIDVPTWRHPYLCTHLEAPILMYLLGGTHIYAPTWRHPYWCTHMEAPIFMHPLEGTHIDVPTWRHPYWCTHLEAPILMYPLGGTHILVHPHGGTHIDVPTWRHPYWCTHLEAPILMHPLGGTHIDAPTWRHPYWCTHLEAYGYKCTQYTFIEASIYCTHQRRFLCLPGTCFTKRSWTSKSNLVKIHFGVILFLMTRSQVTNLHVRDLNYQLINLNWLWKGSRYIFCSTSTYIKENCHDYSTVY